jgi:hypothetical protein
MGTVLFVAHEVAMLVICVSVYTVPSTLARLMEARSSRG